MRTTEKRILVLVGALLCGFFFKLGEQRALAVINCVPIECVDPYAWWISGSPGGTRCFSAQVVGATVPFAQGDNTTQYFFNLYYPSGNGVQPRKADGNYDRYIWTSNTASCRNRDGTFPSPQQLVPTGTPTFDVTMARFTCTYN
jgi:hypothetical protein